MEISMKRKLTWFDRLMTAVTFAEADEHDTGLKVLATPDTDAEKDKMAEPNEITLPADLHGAEIQS